MSDSGKNPILPFMGIGALALILRTWNIISIGNDFYANFLSDASNYRLWATRIAQGVKGAETVFPMGPLYPYYLALNLKMGFSFYSILFVQAILGSLTVVFIGLVARRIFGNLAGFLSAIAAAIFAPFIFYDGLLLSETIQVFLVALALVFLIPSRPGKGRLPMIFISGLFIGLAALGRGTILFFPTLLAFYWLYEYAFERRKKPHNPIVKSVLIIAGTIAGILPATIHNVSRGDFVPIASNFGINLYIGNGPGATGSYHEPPGLNLSSDFTGRRIAERESGRALRASEVSSFWSGKAFSYIENHPVSFVAGLFHKAWLYLWYFDIPQAESIQIQREFSPLFRLPLPGFGFIFVAGVIAMIFLSKDERVRLIALLLLSNVLGTMVFFVIGRFKLIGSLALFISCGAGIEYIFLAVRERKKYSIINSSLAIVCCLLILFLPRSFSRREKIASAYDNVGIFHYFSNRPSDAIGWYRRAQNEAPDNPNVLNNIGAYFYQRGSIDSARYYFHRSLDFDPASDKTLLNLGHIARDMGMPDSARYFYERAEKAAPFGVDAAKAIAGLESSLSGESISEAQNPSFETLLVMAEQAAARKQYEKAEEYYKRALGIRPDDLKALNNLGALYQAQARYQEASEMFSRALQVSGGNAIAYNNLAGAVYKIGEIDSAISLWEEALRLDPGNRQFKKNLDFAKARR